MLPSCHPELAPLADPKSFLPHHSHPQMVVRVVEMPGEALQLATVRALLTFTTAEHFVAHGDRCGTQDGQGFGVLGIGSWLEGGGALALYFPHLSLVPDMLPIYPPAFLCT